MKNTNEKFSSSDFEKKKRLTSVIIIISVIHKHPLIAFTSSSTAHILNYWNENISMTYNIKYECAHPASCLYNSALNRCWKEMLDMTLVVAKCLLEKSFKHAVIILNFDML